MKRLSAPSMSCLLHVLSAGPCSSRELEALQRRLPNGANRSEAAVKNTPFNLAALGYIRHVESVGAKVWELTEQGREVLQLGGQHEPPHAAEAATLAAAVPMRAIAYGRGFVNVPAVPRWVFELGGAT